MYVIAREIGLPATFVDLRHETAHGDIPSLVNLREATGRAMGWLWGDYWEELGATEANGEGGGLQREVGENQGTGLGLEVEAWERYPGRWRERSIGVL